MNRSILFNKFKPRKNLLNEFRKHFWSTLSMCKLLNVATLLDLWVSSLGPLKSSLQCSYFIGRSPKGIRANCQKGRSCLCPMDCGSKSTSFHHAPPSSRQLDSYCENLWRLRQKPVGQGSLSWSQSSSDRQRVHMGDLDAKRYPWYLCLNLSWNRDSRFHKKKCQINKRTQRTLWISLKSKLVQAGPMVQAASLSTWASLTSLQVGIFALAGRIPPRGHQLTSLKSLPRLPSTDSLKGDRWQAVTGGRIRMNMVEWQVEWCKNGRREICSGKFAQGIAHVFCNDSCIRKQSSI